MSRDDHFCFEKKRSQNHTNENAFQIELLVLAGIETEIFLHGKSLSKGVNT